MYWKYKTTNKQAKILSDCGQYEIWKRKQAMSYKVNYTMIISKKNLSIFKTTLVILIVLF